jgi:hypothetical protein
MSNDQKITRQQGSFWGVALLGILLYSVARIQSKRNQNELRTHPLGKAILPDLNSAAAATPTNFSNDTPSDSPRRFSSPLRELWSWSGVGWLLAVLIAVWGVMIAIEKFVVADICLISSGALFFARFSRELWQFSWSKARKILSLFVLLLFLGFAEKAMLRWTQRLSQEALARKTSLTHLEEIPSLNKQIGVLQDQQRYSAALLESQQASMASKQSIIEGLAGMLIKQNKQMGQETISTITGGDSFCYLSFVEAYGGRSFYVKAVKVGRYPLRGVRAEIHDSAKFQQILDDLPANTTGDRNVAAQMLNNASISSIMPLNIGDFSTSSKELGIYPLSKPESDFQQYIVAFTAFNGDWSENFLMKRLPGPYPGMPVGDHHWSQAITVTGSANKTLLLKVDADYPKDAAGKPIGFGMPSNPRH